MGLPRAVRALALAAAVFFLWGCQRDAGPVASALALETDDGWLLAATVYVPAAGENPPGIVLVHDAGSHCEAWRGFATTAQHAGYVCVAIDLRGHGDSTMKDGMARPHREFDDEDWSAMTLDVNAAVEALVAAGADAGNLAIVAAGVGGSVALAYAAESARIQGVGIVSPGLELKGYALIPIMERFPKKPILLMASEGDSYAASTCATLDAMAAGFCEVRTYPGTSNGLDLLAVSDGASAQLIQWLDGVIGAGHGAADGRR